VRWGDRFDAYGFVVAGVVLLAIGLLVGGLVGWLLAVALGATAMNLTSYTLRRERSG
jgi:hypothetical protein